jgi:hypothetical protein
LPEKPLDRLFTQAGRRQFTQAPPSPDGSEISEPAKPSQIKALQGRSSGMNTKIIFAPGGESPQSANALRRSIHPCVMILKSTGSPHIPACCGSPSRGLRKAMFMRLSGI